jgi:hypothetical protein
LAECAAREEQQRQESRRKQAVAEAVAEQERRIAQVEANRKARLERAAEIERRKREVELRNLQIKVQQQSWWQQSVENAARVHEAQQRLAARLALIDDWTPKPPPEPENLTEIVYLPEDEAGSPHLGDPNFNPKLWATPRRWRG